MKRYVAAAALAVLPALALGTTAASAQQTSSQSPVMAERMQAMERMQRDMMAGMSGEANADRRFAAMMIPHHQGALDMARNCLQEGRDPRLREMAEKTIREQGREIGELRRWLQEHPAR